MCRTMEQERRNGGNYPRTAGPPSAFELRYGVKRNGGEWRGSKDGWGHPWFEIDLLNSLTSNGAASTEALTSVLQG
jgi:hypothetical protein